MIEFYRIATDPHFNLETRYAALKIMKEINSGRKRLSDSQLEIYKAALIYRREQLPVVLNMGKQKVSRQLFMLKRKGYARLEEGRR